VDGHTEGHHGGGEGIAQAVEAADAANAEPSHQPALGETGLDSDLVEKLMAHAAF
jgi:hypothetical protein